MRAEARERARLLVRTLVNEWNPLGVNAVVRRLERVQTVNDLTELLLRVFRNSFWADRFTPAEREPVAARLHTLLVAEKLVDVD